MLKIDQLNNKKKILAIFLLFILSYAISLFLWNIIKDVYGITLYKIAASFITFVQSVDLKSVGKVGEKLQAIFVLNPYSLGNTIQTTFTLPISTFTYNSPLTFAIIFSFIPFIKKRRHLIEAFVILAVIHFIFLFLFFGEKITVTLVDLEIKDSNSIGVFLWEFIWGFWDNLVMRFEPFLVGAYLFFSFQSDKTQKTKPAKEKQKAKKSKSKKKKRK